MALSPDQTAVLELLLAGKSYPELGELLGLEEDEVRERARGALKELGGADPDRKVALGDYLLGQADPIGRADVVRHLRQDADDHALATTISERLAEVAPAADLPKLPPAPGGGSFLSRGTAPEQAGERRSPLAGVSRDRGRLYAGLGAAALILVAVVLGVTGAFSGGGDDDAAAEPGSDQGSGAGQSSVPDGEEITRIPLRSAGSGDAAGVAIVGLATGDQPYLDVAINNLEPAPQGEAYVVWFMFDGETGYPLSPVVPDDQGAFTNRFAIPQAVTAVLFSEEGGARSIEIALSPAAQTQRRIQQAVEDETYQIERPGRTVLMGEIPTSPGGGQGSQGNQGG